MSQQDCSNVKKVLSPSQPNLNTESRAAVIFDTTAADGCEATFVLRQNGIRTFDIRTFLCRQQQTSNLRTRKLVGSQASIISSFPMYSGTLGISR